MRNIHNYRDLFDCDQIDILIRDELMYAYEWSDEEGQAMLLPAIEYYCTAEEFKAFKEEMGIEG